jgi:hypothetical protein
MSLTSNWPFAIGPRILTVPAAWLRVPLPESAIDIVPSTSAMTLSMNWRRVALAMFTLALLALPLYTIGAPYQHGGCLLAASRIRPRTR